MARHASTYRQARRAEYREAVANGLTISWAQFNFPSKTPAGKVGWYSYGSARNPGRIDMSPQPNKYIPHIGAKQRAKADVARVLTPEILANAIGKEFSRPRFDLHPDRLQSRRE